jgi:hypothetical protein
VIPGVQVFVYPEELLFVSPEALATQVVDLGCDAVSVALSYHRARRVFPRHGHVSSLRGSTVYFTPDHRRYGEVVPDATAEPELQDAVLRFRDACGNVGIGFRAWLVGLHHESLAARNPEAAAHGVDGSPLGHSLCPSAPEAIGYVAALAADVAARFDPETIDLEAWLYPAWEPSYTLTLALEPLRPRAELLATQCFCEHCRRLLGPRAEELEQLARSVAGPPFAVAGDEVDGDELDGDDVITELAGARASGAAHLVSAVAAAVHREGVELRLLGSGPPAQARLQGLSAAAVEDADSVLLGCARLAGAELDARFAGLRELVDPRAPTVSTNWVPGRTPAAMADDVARLVAAGAGGLALYNLSLVPAAGLDAFRAASAAFHAAIAA